MTCKGICYRFKSKSNITLRYATGQRWCSNCSTYITQNDNLCPCCKAKLRAGPRRKRNKLALKEMIN